MYNMTNMFHMSIMFDMLIRFDMLMLIMINGSAAQRIYHNNWQSHQKGVLSPLNSFSTFC